MSMSFVTSGARFAHAPPMMVREATSSPPLGEMTDTISQAAGTLRGLNGQ